MKSTLTKKASPLVVRPSTIHGGGVFAVRSIAKGEVVGHYEGRRYAAGEVVECELADELTYLFGLSDGTTIDGSQGGNETARLNHSCDPNCEAVERRLNDGALALQIVAKRNVPEASELLIDYGLILDAADEGAYECCCEANKCRGTMAAQRKPGMPSPA